MDVFEPKYYAIFLNGKQELHLFQFHKIFFFFKEIDYKCTGTYVVTDKWIMKKRNIQNFEKA